RAQVICVQRAKQVKLDLVLGVWTGEDDGVGAAEPKKGVVLSSAAERVVSIVAGEDRRNVGHVDRDGLGIGEQTVRDLHLHDIAVVAVGVGGLLEIRRRLERQNPG